MLVPDPMVKIDLEEVAYRAIIRMILENKYRPGDVLLETDLADLLELSRTPVSHALGRLVSQGFLQKRKKKGCFIPVPTSEDASQVFFARQVVESQAAATAARNATPEEVRKLWEVLDIQQQAIKDANKELYSSSNEAFHLGIVRAGKNVFLERFVQEAFWHSNIYVFFFDSMYRERLSVIQDTPGHHKAILEAIAMHDAEAAAELMKGHLESTYQGLFKGWS